MSPHPDPIELHPVERAIDAARLAKNTLSLPGRDDTLRRRRKRHTGPRWVSLTYAVEGLATAADADRLQAAFDGRDDLYGSVVYATGMLYVSMLDTLELSAVEEVLTTAGVTATLTPSSRVRLANARERRRIYGRDDLPEVRSLGRAPFVRAAVDPTATANTDAAVLFTARSLLTTRRLVVALLCGIPVMVLLAVPGLTFPYWQWLCLALTTPVALWSAWPFHRASLAALRRRMPAIDLGASLAIVLTFTWSVLSLVIGTAGQRDATIVPVLLPAEATDRVWNQLYFDITVGVTILMLAGRMWEKHVEARSASYLRQLTTLLPSDVTVVRKSATAALPATSVVAASSVREGEDIHVAPGEVIPLDGVVIGGSSRVAGGVITGGDTDRVVKVNDHVFAGTRNGDTPLKIRVTRTASSSRLSRVIRHLTEAGRAENQLQERSLFSASLLVPGVLMLSLIVFGVWSLLGYPRPAAFMAAIATLCTAAPMAMAVASPTAVRLGLARATSRGIVIRSIDSARRFARADSVVITRNGTITDDKMTLIGLTVMEGENPDLVLRIAGALARESHSPMSVGINRADRMARDRGEGDSCVPHYIEATNVVTSPTGQITGGVDIYDPSPDAAPGTRKHVTATLWRPKDLSALPGRLQEAVYTGSPVLVSWGGVLRGVLVLEDGIKDDAQQAISQINRHVVETVLLTRESYVVARRLADKVGITRVLAGVLPQDKANAVRSVRAERNHRSPLAHLAGDAVVTADMHTHSTVAVVGGADSAKSMMVSDVGVLLGTVDNIDLPGADIVLLRSSMMSVVEAMAICRRLDRVMATNIAFAWGYNIIALILAAAGFVPPLVAAAAMVAASMLIEWRSEHVRWPEQLLDPRLTVDA